MTLNDKHIERQYEAAAAGCFLGSDCMCLDKDHVFNPKCFHYRRSHNAPETRELVEAE